MPWLRRAVLDAAAWLAAARAASAHRRSWAGRARRWLGVVADALAAAGSSEPPGMAAAWRRRPAHLARRPPRVRRP
eukprot:3530481-Alexandrium_andersonii.AAC.1